VSVSARGVVEGRDTLFAIMAGSCERPLSADLPLSLLPGIVPAIIEGGLNLSFYTSYLFLSKKVVLKMVQPSVGCCFRRGMLFFIINASRAMVNSSAKNLNREQEQVSYCEL